METFLGLPLKPRYGTPCNGCGLCCMLELCPAGKLAFPDSSAPCPALMVSEDKSKTYCGLVRAEIDHGMEPILQKSLGIGTGCSMTDEVIYVPPSRSVA